MRRLGLLGGLLLMAASTAPARADDAGDYVAGIYRALPRAGFDYRTVHYGAPLAELLAHDGECAAHDEGTCGLDFIPFCGCQDMREDYHVLGIVVAPHPADTASVAVTLRNGRTKQFRVDLRRSEGLWRVIDVHGPDVPSLVALLRGNPA